MSCAAKKVEDEELEAYLDSDCCQIEEEQKRQTL